MADRELKEHWWFGRCGALEVLTLALPLVISTASWTVIHFIDRMFLTWHSSAAVAAALPAGMLHWTLICFPFGIASYVNTFVAQYHGAGRPERIGVALRQGLILGVLAIPLILLTIPFAPQFFRLVGHDREIAALETIYYQVLAFGAGGTIISAAQSAFFTGRGKTRIVMLVNVVAASVNVVLDYVWVFGHFGFPELGIEGAGWATVVSQWVKVVAYWLLLQSAETRSTYGFNRGKSFDAELFRRLLRYGAPSGLQFVIEIGAFTLFILLVGQLGKNAAAATTLAFNINVLAFVPMIGLGIAVSTIVGQQLGNDRPDLAAKATWTSFYIAFVYMGVMAVLYVAIPQAFLLGHAAGANSSEFESIRDVTVVLLRFVAVYCLFDAMNLIFVSAIKGAGDTRFILISAAIISPLPVLAGWLGIRFGGLGLFWCWTVVTVWICALGIIYWARFLQGKWRAMRVIEAVPPDLADITEVTSLVSPASETA